MLRKLHFNLWYMFHPPWDTGVSPPELLEFLRDHPPGRAIDLGCGTGTNLVTLAQHGWVATGIDFSARAVALAKRKIKSARLDATVAVGDVARLPELPGRYDLALDIGCFHSVMRRYAYLQGLQRILAPDGYWLMYAFMQTDKEQAGPGLAQADLDLILSTRLTLITRNDGTDRQARPSAWFLYQAPASDPPQ
jgi:ubiquinone/menaquinone biosynthesis C-methylase UbiE